MYLLLLLRQIVLYNLFMTLDQDPYFLIEPKSTRVPFVLSIPHCGTSFPTELSDQYDPALKTTLDDTDWHLDKLYDFANELGVTVIYAKYSRWVIDLNREPNSKPLYDDGRLITELCPTTDFKGNKLYLEKEFEPDADEKTRRLDRYFYPYHRKIDEIIGVLKSEFGKVLFWDAHSIRRTVKTIRKEPFPDFILGDNDRTTSSDKFIDCALDSLGKGKWDVSHNEPFRGGYLTRSKGNPDEDVHALQLEMSKDLYMTSGETVYDESRAKDVKSLLSATCKNLISKI